MPSVPGLLNVEEVKLESGMRVMLWRRPELHRVCILLNVAAGARDERLPGTAHMLEHLIFRGSRKYPSLRLLSAAFEEHGADFNAYTAREVTSFDVSMPAESLLPVIGLLGEVMTRPKLNGIAAERDIIREEILSDYDADNSLINVDDWLVRLFYGDAGRPIAGDPDDLAKISSAEVRDFYDAHYAAPNMLLVVAGPIGPSDEVIEVIRNAFSGLNPTYSPWHRRGMAECYARALSDGTAVDPRLCIKKYDGATQSEALLGFLCGRVDSPEFAPLEMLVHVLDDGMASRLSRRLVEELALVYDTEAFISTTQESTLMQIRVTCRHRRAARVINAIYELLREIARDGLEPDELVRLQRRVIWENRALLDNVEQMAQWLSTTRLQNMPCELSTRSQTLLAVTEADIRRTASRLLETLPHIVAIVGDLGERAADEIRAVMQENLKKNITMTSI
ncbi:MAG: insulinase family protein [Proteobacteria bacterium]|nr:insulinase family protein [Pseudomonadota bacterium]